MLCNSEEKEVCHFVTTIAPTPTEKKNRKMKWSAPYSGQETLDVGSRMQSLCIAA